MATFQCQAFGKWILAGEHAVLRGSPALVFPIRTRSLHLTYFQNEADLDVQLDGDHGVELKLLVWTVLEKACELRHIERAKLKGELVLESSLPVGAGMGASAALCVALVRWLGFLGFVPESEYYEFSRQLENIFHGESSGVDIAVALSGQGLRFSRSGERALLEPKWKPHWYISYSGKRGITLDAVSKVKSLLAENPARGQELDARMSEAVLLADQALHVNADDGLLQLAKAIDLAATCFDEWKLNEGAPAEHIQWLKDHGAIAVKPTGSGGGGYVLSLWKALPPENIRHKLIPC